MTNGRLSMPKGGHGAFWFLGGLGGKPVPEHMFVIYPTPPNTKKDLASGLLCSPVGLLLVFVTYY